MSNQRNLGIMKEGQFTNYFLALCNKIHELQKSTQDAFRIVSIINNELGEKLFKIQIIGKSAIFEATPQEIARNDVLLEGFSKKDVRIIIYYATQEIAKPTYKILVQDFEEATNKTVFKLGKRGEPNPLKKTADEISLDKNLLNQMTQQDAHMVGYMTAMEYISTEKEVIKKLALKNKEVA